MNKPTLVEVIAAGEVFLSGISLIYKDQQALLGQDARAELAKEGQDDFHMKNTKKSETTRAQYERLTKLTEKALDKARSMSAAKAAPAPTEEPVKEPVTNGPTEKELQPA